MGRSAFAALLYGLAALAALAVAWLWTPQADGFGWRQAAAFGAAGACVAAAAAAWLRSPAGALRWDGQDWSWETARGAEAGRPLVALDLQSRLLVQWRSAAGRVRWLWLEQESDSAHWEALRRAVYSRASAPIPAFPPAGKESSPAGGPPAAEQ